MLEGLPSLPCGQPGLPAQPADAPLPTVVSLLLQHFQEGFQSIAVACVGEAVHRLRPHGGQAELMAQLPVPGLNGYSVRHQATPDNRLSYTLRSGIPDRLSMGASGGVGLASSLTAA